MRSARIVVVSCVVGAGLLGGCQSVARTAERGLPVAKGRTVQAIATLAQAKDPQAALREGLKQRAALYMRDPRELLADIRAVKRDYENLVSLMSGNVRRKWGRKEVKLPSRTAYVKYTQNYRSRAIVDFDAGQITVETVDEKAPRASLKTAVVTTLLAPDDPRAVDLFSDKPITLTGEKEPFLFRLVHDQNDRPIGAPAQAEAFAEHLLAKGSFTRTVELQQGKKVALSVRISLVPNFENKQAAKYRPLVNKFAAQYKVSLSLVYAIIRTESNFNPFAVSSVPAYGLMQLVPSSGGREAYKRAKGQDMTPTRDYLFGAEANIELGTAYLSVLSDQRLDDVANPTSREYCVISAYNTGPRNVLRTFANDRVTAVNSINRLEPPGVYEWLRMKLPYAETRQYLTKVVQYRRQFVGWANEPPPAPVDGSEPIRGTADVRPSATYEASAQLAP